jgi:RNA polymerase sigma-70 factor, ECF subfamily
VIYGVSAKIGSHLRRTTTVLACQEAWERPPGYLGLRARERAGCRELVPALRLAVDGGLSDQQRTVFTAVALNGVPADALAEQLASNRNAVYKALFEARRVLRAPGS